jgi:hypothetical protein
VGKEAREVGKETKPVSTMRPASANNIVINIHQKQHYRERFIHDDACEVGPIAEEAPLWPLLHKPAIQAERGHERYAINIIVEASERVRKIVIS